MGMFYFQVVLVMLMKRLPPYPLYPLYPSADIEGICEACIFKTKTQSKSTMYS